MAETFILLAALALVVHLLFNAWVVAGALVTEGNLTLGRLHILSLFYGAVMENVSWPCPLTVAQKWFIAKAGRTPYQGDFMIHYLRALVSPSFPLGLLRWGAIAVLLANLWIYGRRQMRPHKHAYHV